MVKTRSWVGLSLLLSCSSLAAPIPTAAFYGLIQSDLKNNQKKKNFEDLIKSWEKDYGTAAVPALLKFASDIKQNDPDRYIALMGATKLGGKPTARLLAPYLKDSSWMIRTGALRALTLLNSSTANSLAIPLIEDPALVVRLEAVETLKILKPKGFEAALVKSLKNSDNYHAGKTTWVPEKALQTLVELNATAYTPQIAAVLDQIPDREFQIKTIHALEKLTNRKTGRELPIHQRIQVWKKTLIR